MFTQPTPPVKLLVVEDDMIIGANIAMLLTNLGYEVTGVVARGEEAIHHATGTRPDIALLDIQLRGSLDGVQTALRLHDLGPIPVIFVTANTDEATFNRAKTARPFAFINKPFRSIDIQRAVELTLSLMAERTQPSAPAETLAPPPDEMPYVLNDRILVRHKDRMVRIALADILYLEADRNYCHLFTATAQYTLVTPLKLLEATLLAGQFLRVHRSYMVNLLRVDEVTENRLTVGGKTVALGHIFRDELLRRIRMV
jgi:DNA-binding LytR/AlgR family response regulator